MFRTVRTATLEIGYQESGPDDGTPVVLLHGWPSDPHDWDGVAPALSAEGCRVLTPWLRGYGPTRFLRNDTPRSGQQAALGADLRDFLDALGIEDAFLAGYDWGGRAACVVAALWPERVRGLVSIGGYNIQHIATSRLPAAAAQEHRMWYQWYFQTERGHAGLDQNRARLRPAVVATVVAELAIRRGDLRGDCGEFRQSRLCRSDDPVLPSPPPQRAG